MRLLLFFTVVAYVVAPTLAAQATTTRYFDGQEGACGCGTNGAMFSWQAGITSGVYTAAGSQALFDSGGSSWCGAGCGKCFQLTSTGVAPSGQGTGGAAGQSIIVMVTNLCPTNGNAMWCPPPGQSNQFGFSVHFDIMSNGNFIWDNAIVNYTQVACPSQAASDFQQCQCA